MTFGEEANTNCDSGQSKSSVRDPKCFSNIQSALPHAKHAKRPKKDGMTSAIAFINENFSRILPSTGHTGAAALNFSSSSFDTATTSMLNSSSASLLANQNSLSEADDRNVEKINKSNDWRVVGEGSAISANSTLNRESIDNANQIAKKMLVDANVMSLLTENSDHHTTIPSLQSKSVNSSFPAQQSYANSVPDVLKQVMDMQVRVHKSIAQNPGLHTSCTWQGSFPNSSTANAANQQSQVSNQNQSEAHPISSQDTIKSGFKSLKQIYSRKVFAGGVPWEATESAILKAFTIDSSCPVKVQIEYPSRPSSTTAYIGQSSEKSSNISIDFRNSNLSKFKPKPAKVTSNYFPGYIYLIFESGEVVGNVIKNCCRKCTDTGKLFFQIEMGSSQSKKSPDSNQKSKNNLTAMYKKDVEFIPFCIDDAEWLSDRFHDTITAPPDFSQNTAFVGALHGQITASMLGKIMTELFGEAIRVSLDLDRWKYPIGSGKITFSRKESLCLALDAGIVEIVTDRFRKRIQVDPYLQSSGCCMCHGTTQLTYFCRDNSCFAYFCKDCWFWRHNAPSGNFDSDQNMRSHIPLTR